MTRVEAVKTEYLKAEGPSAIIICGPTCSGKSAVALEAAALLDGEIVSCDSMQIYRYMDVGTAKPTPEEMRSIRHHMIDIVDPWENYNAFLYKNDAGAVIRDIISRGKTPVVCGGTGLYVNSLIDNREYVSENSDESLPEKYRGEYELAAGYYDSGDAAALHGLLVKYDPEAASLYHANNSKRVLRALKLFFLTGMTRIAREEASRRIPCDIEYKTFVISPDRETLYDNINKRVDIMREQGLCREAVEVLVRCRAEALKAGRKFDYKKLNSLAAIGYREFYELIPDLCHGGGPSEALFDTPAEGSAELSADLLANVSDGLLDLCFERIKQDTRHYAKRQITWFKKTPGAVYID